MKKGLKSICLLLAALLLVLPLAACGNDGDKPAGDGDSTVDNGPVLGGIPVDTVVMDIEGEQVLWEEMYYYLQNTRYSLEYYGEIEDWDAVYEDNALYDEELTYNQFVIRYAVESALQHRAISGLFAEQNQEMDEEYLLTKQDYMDYYGMDDDTFVMFLEANYMTEEVFDYMNTNTAMYYNLVDILYGENGADVPQDEVEAYVDANTLVRAKHILIKTVDDDNAAMSEHIASRRETAESILEELEGLEGDDLLARFDELIEEHGEDPGADYYTEGYVYEPGTMVTEFEAAASALEYGHVSGLVETDYGFHIILRLPVEVTQVVYGGNYPVGYMVALDRIESIVKVAQDELEYTQTSVLDELVPSEMYAVADAEAAAKAEAEAEANDNDDDADSPDGGEDDGQGDADTDADTDTDADAE